jgi:phage-related protein
MGGNGACGDEFMREKKLYYIITFSSTTQAMVMEKLCSDNNISGRLIPLPVKISASCGLAWRMTEEDYNIYNEEIDKLEVEYDSVVRLMM